MRLFLGALLFYWSICYPYAQTVLFNHYILKSVLFCSMEVSPSFCIIWVCFFISGPLLLHKNLSISLWCSEKHLKFCQYCTECIGGFRGGDIHTRLSLPFSQTWCHLIIHALMLLSVRCVSSERTYISFIRLVPRHSLFPDTIVNVTFLIILFSSCYFLVYGTAIKKNFF